MELDEQIYRGVKIEIFSDGEVWVNTRTLSAENPQVIDYSKVEGIQKHFKSLEVAKLAIDEFLDETAICSNCGQTFDKHDMFHHMVGLICESCAEDKSLQELEQEEAAEHNHQQRQWYAYRNGWPIHDDPDRQVESNRIYSQYE